MTLLGAPDPLRGAQLKVGLVYGRVYGKQHEETVKVQILARKMEMAARPPPGGFENTDTQL